MSTGTAFRCRLGFVVSTTLLAGVFALPAFAAPTGTQLDVYRLPCDATTCDDSDTSIGDGEAADGALQFRVRTGSSIGLQRVQLQLELDGGWACVRSWTTSARDFDAHFDLDSTEPINGCDGTLTNGANGSTMWRVFATDRTGNAAASPEFRMTLVNRPTPPRWLDQPRFLGVVAGRPRVELRWRSNPEPDIVEYHFIRSGGGDRVEYAISADHPGGQGCDRDSDGYTCYDDAFPEQGYQGSYDYALVAFRNDPTSSGRCALPSSGDCVGSASSGGAAVRLEAPPPPPPDPQQQGGSGAGGSGSSSGSGGRTPGRTRPRPPTLAEIAAGAFCFTCGEYETTLPYGAGPVQVGELPSFEDPNAADDLALDAELTSALDREQQRRNLLALSGGLLLLILAFLLARMLRRRAS